MFATDFPWDAEGGAILVGETRRSLDELSPPERAGSRIDGGNPPAVMTGTPCLRELIENRRANGRRQTDPRSHPRLPTVAPPACVHRELPDAGRQSNEVPP